MTIEVSDDKVVLRGRCGVEEAEPLLDALCRSRRPVDLSECEWLHTALVQVLLASRARIGSGPASPLPDWLIRLLSEAERPKDGQ